MKDLRSRNFFSLVFLALPLLAAGCASKSSVPRLEYPKRIEIFCGNKEARATALMSILTSTDDRPIPELRGDDAIRALVRQAGGAIAAWNDQPVLLPRTAASIGEDGSYVRVTELAVPIVPDGALKRRIYLRVRARGTQRWVALDAFDVQNPCVEGHRAM